MTISSWLGFIATGAGTFKELVSNASIASSDPSVAVTVALSGRALLPSLDGFGPFDAFSGRFKALLLYPDDPVPLRVTKTNGYRVSYSA